MVVAISDSASAPYVEGKRVTTLGLCRSVCRTFQILCLYGVGGLTSMTGV